ncbi:MAG: Uncharacterized protein G01um101417_201 [Parcubacteria group bacterium Gr01-1014_17]|nr:MAG: Uncharacterized protein G01um101417_201 [Parcubacteria group bacterium Gr01-1014_17]
MKKKQNTSSAFGTSLKGGFSETPPLKGGWGDVVFVLLLVGIFFTTPVFAALPPSPDAILITLSPEKPAPNTLVTATLSILSGGNGATTDIQWLVNGVSVRKGKGETSASFRTGKLGSKTVLTVKLSEAGEIVEKTINLSPASVLLVAESDGTAPPFYRGKTLFSYHGATRIVAIPFFGNAPSARANPKTLSYKWKIADRVPEGSSGVGRDTFSFYAKVPFRPTEITVEVESPDGSAVAEARITAEALAPAVVLYEDHPLYGALWNKALAKDTALKAPEIRVVAQPFFFNKADAGLLKYNWTLNSQKVGSPSDNSVVFRKENAEGSAGVRVEVTNPKAMFQFGDAKTTISF